MSRRIAVLGGGISGLSVAHFLAARFGGSAQITLFEKDKLGGWIQTQRASDGDGFMFELGPRSLRTAGNGAHSLALVERLNLQDQLIFGDRKYVGRRLLYVDGRVQPLPSSPFAVLTSPVLRPALRELLREPFVGPRPDAAGSAPRRPDGGDDDESIDAFFRRRFGPYVASRLAAALAVGVFAGDSRRLSLAACLPALHRLEHRHGSVVRGMLLGSSSAAALPGLALPPSPSEFVRAAQQRASVFSLRGGLQTLTDALVDDLRRRPNVAFAAGGAVQLLPPSRGAVAGSLQVSSGRTPAAEAAAAGADAFDAVVSALPPHSLADLLHPPPQPHQPSSSSSSSSSSLSSAAAAAAVAPPSAAVAALADSLRQIESVSVAIVNVAYDDDVIAPHLKGFGYLVPPCEGQWPVLGVTFDSLTFPQQQPPDRPTATRLTVMLGGDPHMSSMHPDSSPAVDVNSMTDEQLVATALDSLRRHLDVHAAPRFVRASLLRQALPQYCVGHRRRLAAVEDRVAAVFGAGRVHLVGAGYRGVSVNDCIAAARHVADELRF